MMTLVRLLPFILGDFVDDDEHRDLFLVLWDICAIITPFKVTHELSTKLTWLVEGYLEGIVDLYWENAVAPKMHQLVQQMELYVALYRH